MFCKRKGARSLGVHVHVERMYVLYRCKLKVQHVVAFVCVVSYVVCVCVDKGNFKRTGCRVLRWRPVHSNESCSLCSSAYCVFGPIEHAH